MTKRYLMHVGALLAVALFTFGCGRGDDGLSAEDMARIDEVATAAREADVEQVEAEAPEAG